MTTFTRSPAFDSIDALLDWAELHGSEPPRVERGHDGSWRGSVEHDDLEQSEKGDT